MAAPIVKPGGVLEGIQLGLGDIGIVTTIFHSSKLPSQAIAAVTPFVASDAPRRGASAVDEIAREFPTMQNEFDAQNQVYLATGVVLDTYQVFCKEPSAALADLEGDKVAGAGMNLRYLEGIEGAAGVRGGLTDFYNMLQTGLVDHAMLWPEAAATFKISEVAPYMLQADLGAVNTKTVTVNKDYWDEPARRGEGRAAGGRRSSTATTWPTSPWTKAAESREAYVAAGGTIVEMSDEDRAAWANAMPNIAQEWAAGLDASGEPGSEMLRAYLGKLEDAGFTGVRDWTAGLTELSEQGASNAWRSLRICAVPWSAFRPWHERHRHGRQRHRHAGGAGAGRGGELRRRRARRVQRAVSTAPSRWCSSRWC